MNRATYVIGRALVVVLLAMLAVIPPEDAQAQRSAPPPVKPSRAQIIPAPQPVLTNRWIVELVPGQIPQAVAASMGMFYVGPVANLPDHHLFEAPGVNAQDVNAAANVTAQLRSAPAVRMAMQDIIVPRELHSEVAQTRAVTPSDPLFPDQWHLKSNGIKVQQAWDWGYTGGRIRIGIVDEGTEYTHPDLWPNYLATGWDYVDNDANPFAVGTESHATSVAGIAAAAADGVSCGVGVAFNARIVPIRLFSSTVPVTASMEASALGHGVYNYGMEISNNAWGPPDDGRVLSSITLLDHNVLRNAAIYGRGGRGMIYVWSAGNGYQNGDHSGANGYVNSRYTIPVAALTQAGTYSDYSEQGSALIVSAPADPITTTDRMGGFGYSATNCTDTFNGTSAASPVVSGVVAMMLQANSNLTWRDVQAILILTAQRNDPLDEDWTQNGRGLWINHNYGFGMVDAERAVGAAVGWPLLGPEFSFETPFITGGPIPDMGTLTKTFGFGFHMNIESVVVRVRGTHSYRGDLEFRLVSPNGTESVLLADRPLDDGTVFPDPSSYGSQYLDLRSMRHWGEDLLGTWTLEVEDKVEQDTGTLEEWNLTFYGTSPFETQLLKNTGFEQTLDGKTPLEWSLSDTSNGKHVLKPKPYAGTWAFRFMGGTPPLQPTLSQTFTGLWNAGDYLWFGGYARGVNNPNGGRIVMDLQYADGSGARYKVKFNQGTYWWTPHMMWVQLSKDVVRITLSIRFINATTPPDRLFVDNVFLKHIRPPTTVRPLTRDLPEALPLPDAPPLHLPDAPPADRIPTDIPGETAPPAEPPIDAIPTDSPESPLDQPTDAPDAQPNN